MFVELATAIENAGGSLASPNTLNEVVDLRELASVVSRNATETSRRTSPRLEDPSAGASADGEIYVPSFIRSVGNRGLDALQQVFYEKYLHSHYEGRSNIPAHTNFIIAPNHTSHLDMGLTKMALGDAGRDMVALAAADYFFDNKYKRAYMDNFTNLVPIERSGSLRQSLRHARSFLDRGYNALIFPEGTRSLSGDIAEFKPVIGYLALTCKVGILPMYLHGTYEAMPKGSNTIKRGKIGARIGRYIEVDQLEEMTKGMPRSDAYKLIAAYVRHQVLNLRDGHKSEFNADSLRERFRNERRAHAENAERSDDPMLTMAD
jgi:long-chain acyl-CoA synthetase